MGEFDKAEDIMILGLIVLIGYGLYKFSVSFQGAIDGLMKSFGWNTGSGGMDQPSHVPGNKTVADSVGGYDQQVNGITWSCSGPSGSSADVCTPMNCDANANCTSTGPPIPASQVASTLPPVVGSTVTCPWYDLLCSSSS